LSLGGIGKAFYTLFLLCLIAIIINLEHTIRQSRGDKRLKIRSFILGLGGLCAYLIFLTIQNLLFHKINLSMIPVNSSVFIICTVMMAFSVVYHRLMDVDLYISRLVIYNSITLFVIGGYFLFVGLISQIFHSLNIIPGYHFEILFLFVTILLFFSVLLSDQVRWKARMLINRHFYRSRYDYRDEWLKFAEGLSQKLEINNLVNAILNILKDSVGVDKATLWLYDEQTGYFKIVSASSPLERARLKIEQGFLNSMAKKNRPIGIDHTSIHGFVLENGDVLERLQPVFVVPLVSGKEIVGLIFLGKKKTGEAFLGDDIDLLRSSAAQITSAIMNAKLSQALINTKELEVFHRFSSFMLHDLKNLVSSLSLLLQNASEHMSNPQFQENILVTIERSVKKMETLIAKLSDRTVIQTLNVKETNLNELVSKVVKRTCMNGLNGKTVKVDLKDIPHIFADREQMEKVVENLLINALEAIDKDGSIKLQTECHEKKVIFSVSDNGQGMSQDFVANSLFKPFKSGKKKGFGIGLYQCKNIIEAHQGHIEVETQEGVGTTFKSIIPVLEMGQNHKKDRKPAV
jgi:putative PEP-CTERM system histidine kinase